MNKGILIELEERFKAIEKRQNELAKRIEEIKETIKEEDKK